jgi:hypothetical protein
MKSKDTPPSEVTAIAREINKLADNNFTVTTDDSDVLSKMQVSWDDLLALKDELSSQVLNLVSNVMSIAENQQIVAALQNKDNFHKVVNVFFQDVNEYSAKVKTVRTQHEHKSGRIASIEENEEYNKLAVEYYRLSEELINVLAPTVTEIIVMSNAGVADKLKTMETENVGTPQ